MYPFSTIREVGPNHPIETRFIRDTWSKDVLLGTQQIQSMGHWLQRAPRCREIIVGTGVFTVAQIVSVVLFPQPYWGLGTAGLPLPIVTSAKAISGGVSYQWHVVQILFNIAFWIGATIAGDRLFRKYRG